MTKKADGRTARRDRNSDAVLDTVHEMFVEGKFAPSVDEVAARSGVSLRSVYRYFEDTEELLRLAIQRRITVVDELYVLGDPGDGPLAERIRALVDHRLVLHSKLAPSVRAAMLRAPFSEQIASQVRVRRDQLSDQVAAQFAPELEALATREREDLLACLDALCSFETIEHLRVQRRLTVTRTRRALVAGLTTLLAPH